MYASYSLDQLTAFVTTVDEGSFSAAGRRLGRAQSAISYAIAQLEQALDSQLFDRSGHTPVLTDHGRRLAAEARLVISQARDLTRCAAELAQGVESQLRVIVDALYPRAQLIGACAAFRERFPATALRLEVGLLRYAVSVVRAGLVDFGVCNLAGHDESDLHVRHLGAVELVPVCAAQHPLAQHPSSLTDSVLEGFTQIVHSEPQRDAGGGPASGPGHRQEHSGTRDQGVLATRTWRVTDLGLKLDLIARGLGWGSVPLPLATPLIEARHLVRIYPEPWPASGHRIDLHATTRHEHPLGRAGRWFCDALAIAGR